MPKIAGLTCIYVKRSDYIEKISTDQPQMPSLPEGVTAQLRTDGKREFIFLMNFKSNAQSIDLGEKSFTDYLTGEAVVGELQLHGYGLQILERS